MPLGLHEKGYVTWVTRIKAILCNNSFEQVRLFGCGQEDPFFKELKERFYSSFCHGWVNPTEPSTRFSIYRLFKHCFERQCYTDVVRINLYRTALVQFRMGASQIARINIGIQNCQKR